jgi:hypothetical protein
MPDVGDENDNVYRRTGVIRTRIHSSPISRADRWIHGHAMDCTVCMANVINENIQLIEQEERWYEDMHVR